MTATAESFWRGLRGATALADPLRPDIPPRSRVLLRALEPLLRIGPWLGAQVIGRLRVARRIHEASDVPRVAQHELALAAEDLRRPIAGGPRRQVIADRTRHELVDLDCAQV